MRVKVIACLVLAALLVSAPAASASLVGLTFPTIKPVYASDVGDMGKVMALIGDVVKFSKGEVAGHGVNPPIADFPKISGALKSIPGPDKFMSMLTPVARQDQAARDSIYATLVDTNLTYYSIAGQPMNYTITADDIKGINRTVYKGKPAWKVRIGEGLAWDLTMDDTGKKVLDTKQLFQT
jgi:hypothetical protein